MNTMLFMAVKVVDSPAPLFWFYNPFFDNSIIATGEYIPLFGPFRRDIDADYSAKETSLLVAFDQLLIELNLCFKNVTIVE